MSVRSAPRSQRGSQSNRSSQRSSQAGSQLEPLPVMKVPRKDEATGKPIPNLFGQEVMAALRKRGGALWERCDCGGSGPDGPAMWGQSGPHAKGCLHQPKAGEEGAKEGGGATSWADTTRVVEEMATTGDNIEYKHFGLEGSDTKLLLTKTNMDILTNQLVRVAESKGGKVELKAFINAAHMGGLGAFSTKDLTTMFNSVDTDKSGVIEVEEWVKAVTGSG